MRSLKRFAITGQEHPTTKALQELLANIRLLRTELAASDAEAKSVTFSSLPGVAATQLLNDLCLVEVDGFEEAPFGNTSRCE
ncbi:hypothetical protein WJX82_008371 [Trebouxia sp. C0006]